MPFNSTFRIECDLCGSFEESENKELLANSPRYRKFELITGLLPFMQNRHTTFILCEPCLANKSYPNNLGMFFYGQCKDATLSADELEDRMLLNTAKGLKEKPENAELSERKLHQLAAAKLMEEAYRMRQWESSREKESTTGFTASGVDTQT